MITPSWLPVLPGTWDVRGLASCCRVGTGELDTVDATDDGEVPFYIRSPHVQRAERATHRGEAILTPGDGAVGEVFHHHLAGEFAAHQRVYVLDRFSDDIDVRYFYWYFSSHFGWVTKQGTAKSTVESLRRPMFSSFRVIIPPLQNQRRIADYLDRETATIDTLIEKQRELVRGLLERRAAFIEAAVNSPGVQILPLKRFIMRVDQGISPDTAGAIGDEETWVLKAGASNHGRFHEQESKPVPSTVAIPRGIELSVGDLVVSRASGSPHLVGSASIIGRLSRRMILSDKTFRLVPEKSVNARFLYWFLNSRTYREQVLLAISGAEGLANNLPLSKLLNFAIPQYLLDEQRRIADHLDQETAKIDALIAKAERFIELAQERRAALITAAVTGQISVD